MFEEIMVKNIKPKDISWTNPKYLDIITEDEDKFRSYTIYKGAENYIYKKLDIKSNTSKEVFKKCENIWINLKDFLIDKAKNNPKANLAFDFKGENVVYLVDCHHNLVDIFDATNEEAYNAFLEDLDKFIVDITTMEKTRKFYADGKNGIVKLICYDSKKDITKEAYTPIVILEFNNQKAQYKVYTGILLYDIFTFIPAISSYLEDDCISDFIQHLDISEILNQSTQDGEDLYKDYLSWKDNPVEISVRELISLLKKVGYKLEIKDNDQLDTIQAIQDEVSNNKIQEFFNTFTFTTGETAFDILALSELKKIFRYNKLTLLDILTILSKEYLNYDGSKITMDILATIIYNLYDKHNDKRQAESIKDEIKK